LKVSFNAMFDEGERVKHARITWVFTMSLELLLSIQMVSIKIPVDLRSLRSNIN